MHQALLNSEFWENGGNLITVFPENEELLYSITINQFGDSNLFIGSALFESPPGNKGLRLHNPLLTWDLSEFWQIFAKTRLTLKLIQAT